MNGNRYFYVGGFAVIALLSFVNTGTIGGCRFPSSWTGHWFQSGVQHIIQIHGDHLSLKGRCVDNEGDKFLIEDRKEDCYRCVVIHEKNQNVLQYKETYCDSRDTLESLCSRINGDAQLFSMFRVNGSAVSCPFNGPFLFSYNRGYGECRYPASTVDSCTEDFRLLLRYQACPDVPGTESTVEELICLGTWKEGSMRFLVGKLEHSLATTSEEKYRCFIYEELEDEIGFQVAQSGDATCIGLFSPYEGSRTMKLMRTNPLSAVCELPSWLVQHAVWHTLDGRQTYTFNQHTNTTFNVTTNSFTGLAVAQHRAGHKTTDMIVTCVDRLQGSDKWAMMIMHLTMGCDSGYVCMAFHKRRLHVVELQKGLTARNPEDACMRPYFDDNTEFITLSTTTPDSKRCPYVGKYGVLSHAHGRLPVEDNSVSPSDGRQMKREACKTGANYQGLTVLSVGCDRVDLIEFQSDCPEERQPSGQTYQCHGGWEENGTNYLITSLTESPTRAKFCFIYTEVDNVVKLSGAERSCNRRILPGITGFKAYNITKQGECSSLSSGATNSPLARWRHRSMFVVVIIGYLMWCITRTS